MLIRRLILLLIFALPLTAQAGSQKLSSFDYKVLTKASKLMEKGSWSGIKKHLESSVDKLSNDYAKALAYYNLGQASLKLGQYKSAITQLKKARSFNTLEPKQNLSMLKTIGQLYCSVDQWKSCTDHLEQWKKQAPSIAAEDHLLLAQAYSQQDRWKRVIPHIETAIKSKRVAPENWYQLLVASNIQLKRWKAAVAGQRKLVQHYSNKPSHWRQLVSLHMQSRQTQSALSVQRMSIEKGLFTKGKDYRLLSQLYLQNGLPYYAGKTLESAIGKGALSANSKNLELLSSSWIRAKEDRKAIASLQRLTKKNATKKRLKQLAQLQMQIKDWKSAISSVNKALKVSKGDDADLKLLQGIAQTNLKRYDSAEAAFRIAARDSKLKGAASNWLRYLDQIGKESA